MSKFKKFFNPYSLFRSFVIRTPKLWSDKFYLKMQWRSIMGYPLNLKNPQTYNEKLQWLKLYDRNPLYTVLVDKLKVKEWVAEKIGDEYVIPALKVWDNADEIDFDQLPNQFAIKCNHNSGIGLFVCKDKSKMDELSVREGLKLGLDEDYYERFKEWPYKNVPRKIFAEKYMEDETGELRDYKFFCFDGKVKSLFIATDRFTKGEQTKIDFFDENFKHLPFERGYKNAKIQFDKPENFNEMIRLAEILSAGIPHVRVDFYDIKGKIYFGEMTFYPGNGMEKFEPIDWDYKFGSWIELNNLKNKNGW